MASLSPPAPTGLIDPTRPSASASRTRLPGFEADCRALHLSTLAREFRSVDSRRCGFRQESRASVAHHGAEPASPAR
jgi:hypothetical protein